MAKCVVAVVVKMKRTVEQVEYVGDFWVESTNLSTNEHVVFQSIRVFNLNL